MKLAENTDVFLILFWYSKRETGRLIRMLSIIDDVFWFKA